MTGPSLCFWHHLVNIEHLCENRKQEAPPRFVPVLLLVCQFSERCDVNSSSLMLCRSPSVDSSVMGSKMTVEFLLDNLRFNLSSLTPQGFTYEPNPDLRPLNQQDPMKAYRYNPGSFIQLEVSRRHYYSHHHFHLVSNNSSMLTAVLSHASTYNMNIMIATVILMWLLAIVDSINAQGHTGTEMIQFR